MLHAEKILYRTLLMVILVIVSLYLVKYISENTSLLREHPVWSAAALASCWICKQRDILLMK